MVSQCVKCQKRQTVRKGWEVRPCKAGGYHVWTTDDPSVLLLETTQTSAAIGTVILEEPMPSATEEAIARDQGQLSEHAQRKAARAARLLDLASKPFDYERTTGNGAAALALDALAKSTEALTGSIHAHCFGAADGDMLVCREPGCGVTVLGEELARIGYVQRGTNRKADDLAKLAEARRLVLAVKAVLDGREPDGPIDGLAREVHERIHSGSRKHDRRLNELSDACGALKTENAELLRTIGGLTRQLEKALRDKGGKR
jgi:hypothetical protein